MVSFRRKALVLDSIVADGWKLLALLPPSGMDGSALLLRRCDPDVLAPGAARNFRRAVVTAVLQR